MVNNGILMISNDANGAALIQQHASVRGGPDAGEGVNEGYDRRTASDAPVGIIKRPNVVLGMVKSTRRVGQR